MHDAKGRELKVGDRVLVPFTITAVHASSDFCNAYIESIATMPGNNSKTSLGAINTRQMIRANDGDDVSFRVVHDRLETRLE